MTTEPPAWHQALAYAVTGERRAELGRQASPNIAAVAELVRDRPVHHSTVPDDLMAGIGPAQFAAALVHLTAEVRYLNASSAPVIADRPLTADERRLADDSPPHH